MGVYNPTSLKITAPSGGFKQGGWYSGRQYWNGTLSDPGVEHPESGKATSGQLVSKEVNAQSAAAQGVSAQQLEGYLQQQRDTAMKQNPTPINTTPQPTPGAPMPQNNGVTTAGAGAGVPNGVGTVAPINLPDLYKNLYDTSGVNELQKQYDDMLAKKTETLGKINDNPFLSEATRVGRVAKLEQLFTDRSKNTFDQIATKKADIETQLNLNTKQFDMNSQTARDNLSRFNTLLDMGALDSASGDDIANLTRSTGISSAAIYSAIKSKKDKSVDSQVITSTADSGEVTAVVIDKKSGTIISKTSLGNIGNKQTGTTKATEGDKKDYYANALRTDAQKGLTLSQIFGLYTGYLDPDLIYQLYNANSKYGAAKENISDLAKYGVKQPTTGL